MMQHSEALYYKEAKKLIKSCKSKNSGYIKTTWPEMPIVILLSNSARWKDRVQLQVRFGRGQIMKMMK